MQATIILRRVCADETCETILSIYNLDDCCFVHWERSPKKRVTPMPRDPNWRGAINEISPVDCMEPTALIILTQVAQAYDVSVPQIKGDSKDRVVVWARHVAAYLIRVDLKMSYLATATAVGMANQMSSKNAFIRIQTAVVNDVAIQKAVGKIQTSYNEGSRE